MDVINEENENSPQKKASRTLDFLQNISNENEGRRLKNSILLIKQFCVTAKHDDNTELRYAINRFVRGLGSSRESARIGFYSVLVATIDVIPSLDTSTIIESIEKQLQIGGSNSKRENGDIYTGQVLACGALIRSGKFLKSSPEQQKYILQLLIEAGKKRSYLTLATTTFIIELLNVNADQFEKLIWPTLSLEILKPWPEQTVNTLYLLMLIHNRFPTHLGKSVLKKYLKSSKLFSENNIEALSEVLLNIPALSSLKHPIYSTISKEIATSDITESFVNHLDSHINKLNRNKLLAIALLIRNMFPYLKDSSQIPKLLTKNFIKQMLLYFRNHYNNNHDEEFQEEMIKFFDSLIDCLKNSEVEGKVRVAVLRTLLFYPGTFMIENITRSRIVQQVVHCMDLEGIKKLGKLYKEVIIAKKEKTIEENVTEPWLNAERIHAANLLVKLLSHPSMQHEMEWKIESLKLLMNLSIVKHPKYTNIGTELASSLREIFFHSLDLKFSKLDDLCNVLYELMNHLESFILVQDYEDNLRVLVTKEEIDILQQAYATLRKLKRTGSENKYNVVFQILICQMALQIFRNKDLAIASLKELFMCYDRIKSDKKKNATNEADPEWIEVVVDLFLNLLSHNSHLFRSIISLVFPYLCVYLTPSSLQQILSVLDPKTESNPLSTANEDSDLEESRESDNDVEDSEGSEDEEESGNENEFEENENEFEENETVNDKLRMAVREALGKGGYQTDEESIDLDKMSDSEGERLNEALAHAFKQFKPNRGKNSKKQSKDEETLTHFRARVLDLIDIYLDSEPGMLSCLEVMLPLLQTLEFTVRDVHQKPLQMRLKNCLKKLTNLKKFNSIVGVTKNILGDMFNSLLNKGTKSALLIQDMSNEISDCCVFIVKCSQIVCSSTTILEKTKCEFQEMIKDILLNAIDVYFDQRDCLIPYSLFKSIVQLNWEGVLNLIPRIYNFSFNSTTRPFRRSQALELLKLFYLNRRLQISPKTFSNCLAKAEKKFCDQVVNLFEEFCQNPKNVVIKERFIFHIFNLLKTMALHPLKNEQIDWKNIGEKVREYRSHVKLSNDTKKAYNQLCAKLNVPNIVKMKKEIVKLSNDKDEDQQQSNTTPQNVQHKKREFQNTKKLKKEAKKLRMEGISEDFTSFSFSSININDNRINNSFELMDEDIEIENAQKRILSEGTVEENKITDTTFKHKKNKNKMNGHTISQTEINEKLDHYSPPKKKKRNSN